MSTISISNRTTRHILLSGASALMLGAALAAGGASKAIAAETTIGAGVAVVPFAPSAVGWIAIMADTINLGNVEADASGNTMSVTEEDLGVGSLPSVVSVDGNLIGAFATGTSFVNEAEIPLINEGVPDVPDAEGIASVGRAINAAVITAEASDNELSITELDFESGSLENVDNLITAQTTLNRGESLVHGHVPNDYSSSTPGSIVFDSGAAGADNALESEATISVTSAQVNLGSPVTIEGEDGDGASGSFALVDNNQITITVAPDDLDAVVVDGAIALDRNAITAFYRGNAATSAIAIESGGNTTFAGSAALTNLQHNDGVEPDEEIGTASNFDSLISAVIGPDAEEDSNTLSGALSVSDNRISASATGNESLSENGNGYGNLITLDGMMNFEGSGGAPSGASLGYDTLDVTADVTADLALLNHQSNVGSPLVANTIDGEISAYVQNVGVGSIDVSGNRVSSRAVGNAAANAILAPGLDGNNATFDGTAALASGQVNFASDIQALTLDNTILVEVGNDEADDENTIVLSSVTMDENALRATAIGNQVSNALAVGGVDVNLGEDQTLANLVGGNRDDATLDIGAGATLLNVQANYTSAVTADNEGSQILLRAGDIAADVDGSQLRITMSDIEAVAIGGSALNELAIEATSLAGSAGLGNVQMTGEGPSDVNATVEDSLIQIEIASLQSDIDSDDVDSSSVKIEDNLVRALAWGHSATNIVQVEATSTTVPNDGLDVGSTTASVVSFDTDAAEDQFFDLDSAVDLPEVTAAFGALNVQHSNANVSATVTSEAAQSSIVIGDGEGSGDVLSSSVSHDNNAIVSAATGNQATTDMSLALGSLEVADDGTDSTYVPIGNVTNVQTMSGEEPTVSATVNSGGASFETLISGDIDGSSASVSGNLIQAEAHANRSTNRLSASGTEIVVVPSAGEGPLGGLTMDGFDGTGSFDVDAAFSVQNVQSGAETVEAALVLTGVLLDVGGDILSSSVATDDNAFVATAYNNRTTS